MARHYHCDEVSTEQLLLALLDQRDSIASRALGDLVGDCGVVEVRQKIEALLEETGGNNAPTGHIPFTPAVKKVLELALREALQLGHNWIGSEHLLLGLVRQGDGVAAGILDDEGVTLNQTRDAIVALLVEKTNEAGDPTPVVPRVRVEGGSVVVQTADNHQIRLSAKNAQELAISLIRNTTRLPGGG